MFQKYVFLATLAGLVQVAAGQPARPAAATASRWQVAVQGRYQRYNGLAQSGRSDRMADLSDTGTLTFAGPQLVLARALTPRLALETGFGLSYSGWRTQVIPSLIPEWWEWSKHQLSSTTWSVPLRLRYALCPAASHRLGAYLLAGAELLQQNVQYRPEPGTINPALVGWSIHRDVPVALGLGLRYALASRWTLSADGQATVSTRFLFDPNSGFGSFRPGLGGAVGIGYGF